MFCKQKNRFNRLPAELIFSGDFLFLVHSRMRAAPWKGGLVGLIPTY